MKNKMEKFYLHFFKTYLDYYMNNFSTTLMQMQISTSLMMKYIICILLWPNIKENICSKQK